MDKYLKIFQTLGGVFVMLLGLCLCQPVLAEGTSMYLLPGSESFIVGENFSVQLMLDTEDDVINAAQATINFPKDKLEVISISKENSIFSLWPKEPSYSNEAGEISVVGGLPNPGFSGAGNLITIEFTAKKEGQILILLDSAKALANDGRGTNILLFIKNAKYLIYDSAKGWPFKDNNSIIFSSTHQSENIWYSNNNPRFEWQLNDDAAGVSFTFDKNPNTLPNEISEGRMATAEYKKIPDGIWYFHLRFENNEGWSEAVHYQCKIDATPPKPFDIIIDNKGDSTNPKPDVYFETQDDMSGIEKYTVKIDNDNFFELMVAQISATLSPGSHQIVVRASDKALNIALAETILNVDPIETPEISVWPQKYSTGDETLYIEGTAPSDAKLIIFLKDGDSAAKEWQATSDAMGYWSFSTKELIKPGTYTLSAIAQDDRGATSLETPGLQIEITFTGLQLGGLMLTLKNILICLSSLLCAGILASIYFILKNKMAKKILKKETSEAKKSLLDNFLRFENELKNKVELFDSQPGFNEQEKRVYESLQDSLQKSKESILKELEDIEGELK